MQKYPKRLMLYLDSETVAIIDEIVKRKKIGKSAAIRQLINEFGKSPE